MVCVFHGVKNILHGTSNAKHKYRIFGIAAKMQPRIQFVGIVDHNGFSFFNLMNGY